MPDLRVMDVTTFYTHTGGGVRTYLQAKIRHLADSSVSHSLVVPGPRWEVFQEGRTTVYRLPGIPVPFSAGYRLLVSGPRLRDIIARERPQILEVGSPFLVPRVSRWAANGRNIRTIGFYHSDLVRTYVDPYSTRLKLATRRRLRARARRFILETYRGFDLTLASSPSVTRELQNLGIENVRSVPLGVDLEAFHPKRRSNALRQELGVPREKPIAVFAGRLHLDKGLDVLTEAHGTMDPSLRPHLLLVGKGPLEKSLRGLSRERPDLSVWEFMDDRAKLAGVFASADAYVASGPAETFGLSIAEAMACGTPVVGVDSGAVPDRLAGSGAGELYTRGDSASCAAALERMTARVSTEVRAAARGHAEREFSWRRTFDRLLNLYHDLLRGEAEGWS